MILTSILPKVGKYFLRTVAILICIILAIFGCNIHRPILKAMSWIISTITFIGILIWLMSLF